MQRMRTLSAARRVSLVGAVLGLAVVAAAVPTPAPAERAATAETGTLALNAVLKLESRFGLCPAGAPAASVCEARLGAGTVSGLAKASVSYAYVVDHEPANCPSEDVRLLGSDVRLVVAGKGELSVTTAASGCLSRSLILTPASQRFTVAGGTGIYAGASGSGTVTRALSETNNGAVGMETWKGTLIVAGLEFDVTPPTVSGAVVKTVRAPKGAKSTRVTYRVTAQDAVDGPVPTSCAPRSASRFKVGRTKVRCSATDASGNTVAAAFTVTVRPRR